MRNEKRLFSVVALLRSPVFAVVHEGDLDYGSMSLLFVVREWARRSELETNAGAFRGEGGSVIGIHPTGKKYPKKY